METLLFAIAWSIINIGAFAFGWILAEKLNNL